MTVTQQRDDAAEPPLAGFLTRRGFNVQCTQNPSIGLRRGRSVFVSVNVDELFGSLAGLPGARPVSVSAPLTGAYLVAGLEVAATTPSNERALRRTWRDRQKRGATPLLLLADDPVRPDSVLTVGPRDEGGELHSVAVDALAGVLHRISAMPSLEAVRELSAELDRLDQAGLPGVKVHDLLTLYMLDVRLRRNASRWGRARELVKEVARGADWRATLTALGYTLERRRQRGWLARVDSRPVLVVHPKQDAAAFARLDDNGRPPEGLLLNDCLADGAAFGILAAGGRLRLFHADPLVGSASAQYLDLDASTLQDDDRPLLAILSPEYLAGNGFEELVDEARNFGTRLRARLDETIRQDVLPTLARSMGEWAREQAYDVSDDSIREELERATLTLVFRALFLLYAESARYLPMDNRAYRQNSLTGLVEEANATHDRLGAKSKALWGRFRVLVDTMRTGNDGWGVPPYNGALFAPDGFDGAAILERLTLPDDDFADVLIGIGRDPETDAGVDYSTLEIGHLGHIYESLLSLQLSMADAPLRYDARPDRYVTAGKRERADIEAGDLLWQTHEGGRKSGGVYYTRSELVRHLIRQAVVPAFETHLDDVRNTAATDPRRAADELFDFAVLDPACGSAHFLVMVIGELADMVVRFLATTPLPAISDALERLRAKASATAAIDDVALLRRLVLKRCVFGVDVSPMGAEIAKLSLWLASFVPGLSLAYLDRNVVVGNSLVGVARPEALLPEGGKGASLLTSRLHEAITEAAKAVRRVAEGDDRTPEEVEASHAADAEAIAATQNLARLFDIWTAEPFGVEGARQQVEYYSDDIVNGRLNGTTTRIADAAEAAARDHRFLHWPLAFPAAFDRDRPGFDAVIGNPPWEQVMVKENEFYGLFAPGIRGLPEKARLQAIQALLQERKGLDQRLRSEQERVEMERAYLNAGDYEAMPGHPDLYKFFCLRYRDLAREHGRLGVVLPRSTFSTKGSAGFRAWLFEDNTTERVDFLLNTGRWAFDSEPRYTIALVAARRDTPSRAYRVHVVGTADSLAAWQEQSQSSGIALSQEAFGPDWTVPLLRDQAEADLLARLRQGSRFPLGSGDRWKCFAIQELNETFDRALWSGKRSGWRLWKGESFDQYDPHGADERWCPNNAATRKKVHKARPGADSLAADEVALEDRRRAVLDEIGHPRLAFRDTTNRTNSRTVLACLVPPETFLSNTAPYLAFRPDNDQARAACLAIMNSLPFDWQARRFVEIHVNFFILEGLVVPDLSDDDYDAVSTAAARLSCVDERFAEFAVSVGVDVGPLDGGEHDRLRAEIDARVSRAWNLTSNDLDVLFADFTTDAVSLDYRERVRARLRELT
jgi:hypothetical protein